MHRVHDGNIFEFVGNPFDGLENVAVRLALRFTAMSLSSALGVCLGPNQVPGVCSLPVQYIETHLLPCCL